VDGDLGVDAPIIIPNTNMIIGGSKQGILYVVDRTNMGKYNTSACNCDNQILQSMNVFNGQLQGSVVYWESNSAEYIYGWTANDYLKSFKKNGNAFDSTPASQSTFKALGINEIPGGILSVSSNGTTAGTGIVWGNVPLSADSNLVNIVGVLRAFDATDLSKELWNSNQNSNRDGFGSFAKFNAPIIVNGKVYQPTFSGQVSVYGLLSSTSVDPLTSDNAGAFLNQNFPNPAFQTTSIKFGVSKPGKVVITLFHSDGTQVKTLFQGNVNQNATIDLDTSFLPGGMYIYRMITDNVILAKPLLIIK